MKCITLSFLRNKMKKQTTYFLRKKRNAKKVKLVLYFENCIDENLNLVVCM